MLVAHPHDADPSTTPSVLHADPSPAPLVLDSAGLLRGQREIQIRHGGEVYRLRHTRNDKLILTK